MATRDPCLTCKLMKFTEYLLLYSLIFQRPLPLRLSPVLCVCLLVLLLVADFLLLRTLNVVGRESKKDKLRKMVRINTNCQVAL
jgi:hypothetical protein